MVCKNNYKQSTRVLYGFLATHERIKSLFLNHYNMKLVASLIKMKKSLNSN